MNSHSIVNNSQIEIERLEKELEQMTMALAQAWDQLVPFLQDAPTPLEATLNVTPLLESIMAAVDAPMGAVYFAPHGGRPADWIVLPTQLVELNSLELSLSELIAEDKPVHISNVMALNAQPMHWMFTPMRVDHEVVGAIGVGIENGPREFNSVDARLMLRMTERVVSQLVAVDLAESKAREAKLVHELQIAGLIQRSIQPASVPQIKGIEVAADWQPASTIGGDAWGWVDQPSGRLVCFMVDVAGKGLPAALAAVSLHTALRMVLRLDISPVEALTIMNAEFYDAYTNASILATATVVAIDPTTGEVDHANAGHTPTLLRINGEWQRWKASAPPLGVLEAIDFTPQRIQLAEGDLLLLYSDGLSEIETADGWWTDAGLVVAASVQPETKQSAYDVVHAILDAAQIARDGKSLHDDQTLVGITYQGTSH